jgi:hypothetical protein
MKKPSPKARGKALRPKPFEDNKVDFSKFKMEPSASDIAKLAAAAGTGVRPFQPIEVLSPAKTVGLGRTYLSLNRLDWFVTAASTPYAEFRQAMPDPLGGVVIHLGAVRPHRLWDYICRHVRHKFQS